jgi:hypothetical protein
MKVDMKALLTLSLLSLIATQSFADPEAVYNSDLYTTNQTFESESIYRRHLANLGYDANLAEKGKLLITEYEVPELNRTEAQKCLKTIIKSALAGTEFAELIVLTTHGALATVPGPKQFLILDGADQLVVRKDLYVFTASDGDRRRFRGSVRAEVHGKTLKDGTTGDVKRRLISCKLRLENNYIEEAYEMSEPYPDTLVLLNASEKEVLILGSADYRKREVTANSQKNSK